MRLDEYPRPAGDTGLGIHASPANTYPLGEDPGAYGWWASEYVAMGFKWVKLVVGGLSGIEPCRVLLAHGIMPIVRFYQAEQAPRALVDLQPDLGRWVREYVNLGVRYFEVSNEPNLFDEWFGKYGPEWQKGAIPDRVAEAWVKDAQVVFEAGGLPGIPALSPGGNYNDVDFLRTFLLWLKQRGHAALLQRGAWCAIHNGTLNHPLDYPGDPVNQRGVPVTQAAYDAHPRESWAGSRDEVNAWRLSDMNAGQTLSSVDVNGRHTGGSNCWDKYKEYQRLIEDTFGFQLPILGTEGGVWIGDRVGPEDWNGPRIYDRRYPAVSVQAMTDWTVEICRSIMADEVPAYYFCSGFWLTARKGMGGVESSFERDAWYSYLWDNGHLPVVEALKALPKRARVGPQPVEPAPRVLAPAEIAAICRAEGFTGLGLTTAVAIVLAESGGDTLIIGDIDVPGPGDRSRGMWQFNSAGHPEVSPVCAFDPVCSTREAYRVSGGGQFWTQWSTYNAGTYLKYWDVALSVTGALPGAEDLRDVAYWQLLKVPYTPGNALTKEALRLGGGVPMTPETPFTVDCAPYIGQLWLGPVDGVMRVYLLYCRDKVYDQVFRFDL